MDSNCLRHLLQTAATGSLILLSTVPLQAGRMFPDTPSRPHVHAGLMPNWGFNQTCWRRFPPVAPCDTDGSCYADQGPAGTFESEGQIYTPQGEIMVPGGGFESNGYSNEYPEHSTSDFPGSTIYDSGSQGLMFPHNSSSLPPNGLRYSQPAPRQEASDYAVPRTAIPPIPEPSFQLPPANGLQPAPLQEFHSLPQAPAALPPLPSPPQSAPSTGIPPIPTQTSASPQRLILGADGRLAVASDRVTIARPVSGSSRYGRRNAAGNQQQFMPPAGQSFAGNSGVPVKFASESTTAAPDSQMTLPRLYSGPSQPPASSMPTMGNTNASARYGTPRTGQVQRPAMEQNPVNASPQFRPVPRSGSYR